MTRRNFKSQMEADVKDVFLSLDDFAELASIKYYADGLDKPPADKRISVVVETDEDMTRAWNKHKAAQIPDTEPMVKQQTIKIYCALEDFSPRPKRKRKLEIDGRRGEITNVTTEAGMLLIEMRTLGE